MKDIITIEEFKKDFVSTVDGILEDICDLPGTYTFLVRVAISLEIHILSLKNVLKIEL